VTAALAPTDRDLTADPSTDFVTPVVLLPLAFRRPRRTRVAPLLLILRRAYPNGMEHTDLIATLAPYLRGLFLNPCLSGESRVGG